MPNAKRKVGLRSFEQIISSKVYQVKRQFRLPDSNEMILRRHDAIQLRKYISNVIPVVKSNWTPTERTRNISNITFYRARERGGNFSQLY